MWVPALPRVEYAAGVPGRNDTPGSVVDQNETPGCVVTMRDLVEFSNFKIWMNSTGNLIANRRMLFSIPDGWNMNQIAICENK